MVLSSGARTLGHSVAISVHRPPARRATPGTVRWRDEDLVEQAREIIVRELRALLEKDVVERVVGANLRRVLAEVRERNVAGVGVDGDALGKPVEKRGLKGLSFKKRAVDIVEALQKADEDEISKADEEEAQKEEDVQEEDADITERPRKRQKKEVRRRAKKVVAEDIESEDDDTLVTDLLSAITVDGPIRKRTVSEDLDEPKPARKKQKTQGADLQKIAKRKPSRTIGEVVLLDGLDFKPPDVTPVRVKTARETSLSPSRSPSPPSPEGKSRLHIIKAPSPSPPPNPLEEGICDDDEDLYFARIVLTRANSSIHIPPPVPPSDPDAPPPFRKHLTGSARTEGYYKISHAEKSAYVAQYVLRSTYAGATAVRVDAPQPQHITSSRSNRANARRRAQGLEEINQVQRAVALSKGETAASELTFKFNQLQTRKKHLRFARSPIHDWGLYAMERISRGEMVIEYVGEVIRAQVAEKREKVYERQGIGSSYLFRIDEDLVVDATKKGNLGCVLSLGCERLLIMCCRRLINHSCDPNCTAKIITINGDKKIVIYAKQDIELGDEITYGAPISSCHPLVLDVPFSQIITSLSNKIRFLVSVALQSAAGTLTRLHILISTIFALLVTYIPLVLLSSAHSGVLSPSHTVSFRSIRHLSHRFSKGVSPSVKISSRPRSGASLRGVNQT
jgi:histone-lysine N-methyltransferase SETD1